MNRYNRCKECFNMKCIFITGEREDIDTSECKDFRPMTNADRIRSMTDKELAIEETSKGGCPHDCKMPDDMDTDCVRCWLEWLKQEVDNG